MQFKMLKYKTKSGDMDAVVVDKIKRMTTTDQGTIISLENKIIVSMETVNTLVDRINKA